MNTSATLESNASRAPQSGGAWRFARHFVEMLAVMFLGMLVLGGMVELLFAAAGSSFAETSGTFQVLVMGFTMTVPMVAWMGYRGHSAAQTIEMAGSMVVPTLAAAALAAAGILADGAALGAQHAVMIPAMLGVMLRRYDEYSQPHGHS
jgi:hypothetical protein